MAGYLDQYGAGEEKREHIIRNIIVISVSVVVLGGLLWFLLLPYHQIHITKRFLSFLQARDYTQAYAAWGCVPAAPCPIYSYEKFLEDWGPKSSAAQNPVLRIAEIESCNAGELLTINTSPGRQDKLWIDRNNDALGFAPFPVCPGKNPWLSFADRTVGRLRRVLF